MSPQSAGSGEGGALHLKPDGGQRKTATRGGRSSIASLITRGGAGVEEVKELNQKNQGKRGGRGTAWAA